MPIPWPRKEAAASVTNDPVGRGPVGPSRGTGCPLARTGAPVRGSTTKGPIVCANGMAETSGRLAAITTAPVALSAATSS